MFIERTDAEAAASILWPPDVKSRHWKRCWCCERLKAGEGGDRGWMVGWHHWIDGHESEQTLVDNEGQGSLACCSPWGHKESDTTEGLETNVRSGWSPPLIRSPLRSDGPWRPVNSQTGNSPVLPPSSLGHSRLGAIQGPWGPQILRWSLTSSPKEVRPSPSRLFVQYWIYNSLGDLPFLTRHGYYRNLPDNITFNTYQLNTKIFPEGHAFHMLFLDALTSVFGLNHTTRVMHLVPLFSHVAPMGHPSFEDPLSSHPLSIHSSNGHKPLPRVSTDLSIRERTSPSEGRPHSGCGWPLAWQFATGWVELGHMGKQAWALYVGWSQGGVRGRVGCGPGVSLSKLA